MPSAFEEFELRLNSTEVTENALLSTKGFGGRGGGMCPCYTQSPNGSYLFIYLFIYIIIIIIYLFLTLP